MIHLHAIYLIQTELNIIFIQKIATSIQRLLQFLLLCFSAIVLNAVVTPWFLLAAVPICIVYFVTQRFYRCSSRLVTSCGNSQDIPNTLTELIMHLACIQVLADTLI
jgi:hypothetical protein